MTATKPPLKDYERNDTSQYGEDGVIERELAVIGDRSGWCVEFGASDGVYLSNTHRLINREGFSAVLIEASDTAVALQKRYEGRSDIFVFKHSSSSRARIVWMRFSPARRSPLNSTCCPSTSTETTTTSGIHSGSTGRKLSSSSSTWRSLSRSILSSPKTCRSCRVLRSPGWSASVSKRGIDSSTLQSRMQYSSMRSTIPGSASPTALRLLSGRSVLSSPTFFSFMMGRFVLRGARS